MLGTIVWRDIKVRYKQTVLGALWAIIQPVATTVLFTVFFGRLGGLSKQVAGSYSLFVFVGLSLYLIGSVGVFFARLIKAAVCRQRELLADASGVQFTTTGTEKGPKSLSPPVT